MAKKLIRIPFPIKGYDSAWAYSNQPKLTSPKLLNVRAFTTDEERARGGQRPGTTLAYSSQIGGTSTSIQGIYYGDWGFGDTVFYDDNFNYSNGKLSSVGSSYWTTGTTSPYVLNNYIHPASLDTNTTVQYNNFGGDTWDEFEVETDINWNYGSDSTFTWAIGSDSTGTNGCKLVVTVIHTVPPDAIFGFYVDIEIELTSGSNSDNWSAHYGRQGTFVAPSGGPIRIIANKDNVKAFFQGYLRCSCDRSRGTCSQAHFTMRKENADNTLLTDNFIDCKTFNWYLTAKTGSTNTQRRLMIFNNDRLYKDNDGAGSIGSTELNGSALSNSRRQIYGAWMHGQFFYLDGTEPRWYNPIGSTAVDWTPRHGNLEKDCTLIINWNNRLVLSGSEEDPQNYYMSRQDNAWDFDFGFDDAQSAVAGNLSDTGKLAEPIQAMIPIGNDMLIFGCSNSIWLMRGDPAQGGWIANLSRETGILSQTSWCQDEGGIIYFLGTHGFYSMTPGSPPQHIAANRIPELSDIDRTTNYINVVYDANRIGINLFISPQNSSTGTHYFYDIRLNAFFKDEYNKNPVAAIYYDATGSTYKQLIMGTDNGYILRFDDTVKHDSAGTGTTLINSYVLCSPKRFAGGFDDAKITRMVATLDNTSDDTSYAIWTAPDAEGLNSTGSSTLYRQSYHSGTLKAGRNHLVNRSRGGALAVYLSNDTKDETWSLEYIDAEITQAGRQRRFNKNA